LYGRAVPEDLIQYSANDLTALAARAYDFIADRAPGVPKIRCETVALASSGEHTAISVVEIVNDDMPFLVDSVMGEIADRRLDVRLVAHPMFAVQRKGSQLTAMDAPTGTDASRESFIHIHLAPIADEKTRADLVSGLQTVLGEVRVAVQDWRAMRD